jgi:hypothetical protein
MPDEPPENLENLPGFTGSEGLALCHNDKKPSQNITLHSALSTLPHVVQKFPWNFY